jgi:hypothetical protein
MQFPCVFYRTASFDDAVPTGAPSSQQDNMLSCRSRDSSGMPLQRIAIIGNGPSGGPSTLTASLYVYEQGTGHWVQLGNSLPLQMGVAGVGAKMVYFDAFSTGENPGGTLADVANPVPGAATFLLVVTNPGGLAAGNYVFAMAPTYTATP